MLTRAISNGGCGKFGGEFGENADDSLLTYSDLNLLLDEVCRMFLFIF